MKAIRFSLRRLLVSLTVLAIALAIGANRYHVWRVEHHAMTSLARIGISVSTDGDDLWNPLYSGRLRGVWLSPRRTKGEKFGVELQSLKCLRHFNTENSNLTCDELKQILPVRLQLNDVSLVNEPSLTDDCMQTIAKCERLRIIVFNRVPIGDAAATSLAHLNQVEDLALIHTEVTPKSLSSLKKIPALHTLTLGGIVIDDEWLTELSQLKNLRYLRLIEETITEQQIDRLRAELPGCEVVVSYRGPPREGSNGS
jgi:hypothetical protein